MRLSVAKEIVAVVILCLSAAAPISSPAADRGVPLAGSVHVDDIDIAYQVLGSGDPLVMIMGYGGSMDLWSQKLVRLLSATHRVLIFDNRGMGRSTSSDREYSVPLFAEDTLGLMNALEIDKATVLAWSLGTETALELALAYPEKVKELVLISGSPGGKEGVQPAPEVARFFTSPSASSFEWGLRLIGLLFPQGWLMQHPFIWTYFPTNATMNPAERTMRQYRAFTSWDGCSSRLGQISSPALIIAGDKDVVVPAGNSLLLAEGIRASRLVRFPDGGHGVIYQYPDLITGEIADFLRHTEL
ncbi:MAG TPA: alpha/beta hydrolase [Spirochaetia bacterium]|nr:alpha/beta hydrolase [Spirochaetia bacterium]